MLSDRLYISRYSDAGRAPFPTEVLERLKGFTQEALDELTAADPESKRVYEAFSAFKKRVSTWMNVSERVFFDQLM